MKLREKLGIAAVLVFGIALAAGLALEAATPEVANPRLASLVVIAGGNPTYGADATGQDAYATVITAPARVCHYVHVSVGDNGALLSLDGGTTDHCAIPANTERFFSGLGIDASSAIQGKNLTAGSNYTNLRISVW